MLSDLLPIYVIMAIASSCIVECAFNPPPPVQRHGDFKDPRVVVQCTLTINHTCSDIVIYLDWNYAHLEISMASQKGD